MEPSFQTASNTLEKVCEDYPRKLYAETQGTLPVVFTSSRFLHLSERLSSSPTVTLDASQQGRMHRGDLECINAILDASRSPGMYAAVIFRMYLSPYVATPGFAPRRLHFAAHGA